MNWQDLNTPKKCFNARQSTAGALQDLLAEEKQIIERSTDARLERNRSRQRVLAQDIHEVSRAENSLVQTAAEPARVAEIADLIKKNMHEERGLISEIVTVSTGELGGVPRCDSAFFRRGRGGRGSRKGDSCKAPKINDSSSRSGR